jgi:hypothetical protein
VFLRQEDMIAARQEMVAKYLNDVNDTMQGIDADSGMTILNDNNVLAVPELMVNRVIVPDPMTIDEKPIPGIAHHHGSDSGLGSSVDTPVQETRTFASTRSSIGSGVTTHSAITKSFSAPSLNAQSGPELSSDALRNIRERILQPILANSSLKEYHPLVESIPSQVHGKIIANLRDLEKTFLYEAPRFSLSPNSFIQFWELSIQCLHTTVDYLNERDQRRPSDRPYTNNYFLDLVEQIRRYAEIMRRTREKEENGEELDEMDYTRDEQITVQGGLSNNGKPAELVRKKNGQTIPLIPEDSRPSDETMSSKRPHSDDEYDDDDDDDVYRSMARRRKSDKAGDVMHVCSTCRKEFKRPCDLTKHEKTHSRPFKCTEPTCRYHDLGWPTEKERDRHINDKHAPTPMMHHCMFPPCSYSSKRESNCKQHMEKAHNWTYVRSKSNGRNKNPMAGPSSVKLTPSTPLTPRDATPLSGYTPESNFTPSPWWPADNGFNFGEQSTAEAFTGYETAGVRRDSTTTAATNFTFSSGFSPDQFPAAFDTAPPSENLNFNSPLFPTDGVNMDFGNFTTAFQQPTPAMSVAELDFSMPQFTTGGAEQSVQQDLHISPTGHGDVTLYSPAEVNLPDEGYGDGFQLGGPDFLLFPGTPSAPTSNQTNWFPEMHLNPNGGNVDMGFDSSNLF